jgi:hypothetical protein
MTPALLGLGMTAIVASADAPLPELATPAPVEFTVSAPADFSARAPALSAGLGNTQFVQLGHFASPFQRSQLMRTWTPAPAFLVGMAGGLVGAVVATFTGVASSFLTIPLGVAGGMHMFTDAGFGYEFLGAFIGFIILLPVALVTVAVFAVSAVGSAANGNSDGALGTLGVGMVVLFIEAMAIPTAGAYLAASIHHKSKSGGGHAMISPTVMGQKQRTPGAMLAMTF